MHAILISMEGVQFNDALLLSQQQSLLRLGELKGYGKELVIHSAISETKLAKKTRGYSKDNQTVQSLGIE